MLTVDQSESSTGRSPGNMRQLNTNTDLFLGQCRVMMMMVVMMVVMMMMLIKTMIMLLVFGLVPGGVKERGVDAQGVYMWGLMGCVSHLSLSPNHHLSLLEDSARGRNIHTCGT